MKLGRKWKILFGVVVVLILLGVILNNILTREAEKERPDLPGPVYELPPDNLRASSGDMDNNEPTVAINPKDPDNIVVAANDYNTPTGAPWVGFYSSRDGGENWSESLVRGYPGDSKVTELTGFRGAGDPVLATSSEGDFYLAGIAFKRSVNPLNPIGFGYNVGRANGIFVAKSDNGGESFDQVSVVWTALQSLVAFHDKEWLAVDPNNGNVYVCWAMFNALALSQLVFSRSTDGGQTWSAPVVVSEFESGEMSIQGSAMVVDNDGTIHITWIDFRNNQVRYARSTDQGKSFRDPVSVAPVTPLPSSLDNGNYRTPTMTMLAVDNSGGELDGSLYATWADHSNGDGDVLLTYSRDGGDSWSDPVRVNNDTVGNGADQFFPAVAVSREGAVHVTFYDRRRDRNNTLLEYWWGASVDGGESFSFNQPISDAAFNGDHSRNGDNDFIGDYTGVTASNNTVAAVWCDTREGSEDQGDTEIYMVAFRYDLALESMGIRAANSTDVGGS